jgi:thiamine-monophosphate kinase
VADGTAREIGEFGLIAAVTATLGTAPQVLLGPGDDAAVVAVPDGRVVATTDVLVEGVHFRRDWSSAYDIGRRAAAANLADVAAMGGCGTALLVGLAAPGDLPVEWALGLAAGLRDEAALVGAAVVGGDTVAADQVVVSVTALGDLGGRTPVSRAGARPGDVVVLVGRWGESHTGLLLLERGDPELLQRYADLVECFRRPAPPYDAGPALADLGATAMCDVSDGLAGDLGHLLVASGVGVDLDLPPLAPRVREALADLGVDPAAFAVTTGGDDHALLACVPPDALAGTLALGGQRIGTCSAEPGLRAAGAPVAPVAHAHWPA